METAATTRPAAYPIGIIVVVLATAIRGVLIVLALLVDVGAVHVTWVREISPIPLYPIGTDIGLITRGLLIGLLLVTILSVWGLLRRYEWGWTISIVAAGIILALGLGWWAAGDPHYASMLINSIAVFYLNQRDVRATYKVGHG